jgi:hypothetical protein
MRVASRENWGIAPGVRRSYEQFDLSPVNVLVQPGVGRLDIGEVGLFAFGFRADAVPKMTPAKRVWDFGE